MRVVQNNQIKFRCQLRDGHIGIIPQRSFAPFDVNTELVLEGGSGGQKAVIGPRAVPSHTFEFHRVCHARVQHLCPLVDKSTLLHEQTLEGVMTKAATDLDRPLTGVQVHDFSQYLSGPVCAMRLAGMGAKVIKVIKIERTHHGDQCRKLAVAEQWAGDDSLLFLFINRGKHSVEADLKNAADLDKIRDLITTADAMIHNIRPGVMERIGLGYDDVKALNPRIVCGVVSGYGNTGPWRDLPGQDLLAQSPSGMLWLTGSFDNAPMPFGLSVTDITAGAHLAQGILAALLKQPRTGQGSLVEVSLLAAAMDLQFEPFSSYLNDADTAQLARSAVLVPMCLPPRPTGFIRPKMGISRLRWSPFGNWPI